MKCLGITKDKKQCRNSAKFVFCKKHAWQPLTAIVATLSLIGFLAGFFQDIIKPLVEKLERNTELQKAVAVEIKNNRRTFNGWEDKPQPMYRKSDVVTIFLDKQPIKSIEFYHTVKDQRFKEYLLTSPLADSYIPTAAEYRVVDLDGDRVSEIVIVLTNQLYGFHGDNQVNVLIFNPIGELLARTPYPRDLPDLILKDFNPYSAYKTTVVAKDNISGSTLNSTFANDFNIVERKNKKYLQFSWVIDNVSYAGLHLHQVEEFELNSGKLVALDVRPSLYISVGWKNPTQGELIGSIQQARDFLDKNNMPPFSEVQKIIDKFFQSSDRGTVKRGAPQVARPLP